MGLEHKIEEFINKESSAGVVLMFVTIAAMVLKTPRWRPLMILFCLRR